MESLAELYAQLREPIFRFLYHLTGKADVAEELTQETFLQALLSFSRFRGEARVSTWLYGIARNVYRKWARRHRRPDPEPDVPPPDPLDQVAASEERAELNRALAAMPETYRTALIAREFQGLSYWEVGQVLGHTETWARVTCFRARQMLREFYLKENGGDGG